MGDFYGIYIWLPHNMEESAHNPFAFCFPFTLAFAIFVSSKDSDVECEGFFLLKILFPHVRFFIKLDDGFQEALLYKIV